MKRSISLFHPAVPPSTPPALAEVLAGRWIGQGPRVDQFERAFHEYLRCDSLPVAVGAGTDALHLAYILAGIGPGSEVIAPVFGCVATNLPLLYQGAVLRFADVQPGSLNVDPRHVRELVTDRTRAIVCVHYGGLPCDMDEIRAVADERGIPVIEDAAQALGANYRGRRIGTISEFTAFSFQALKHFTTGDGGMLVARDERLTKKARRLRWFGIDREAKLADKWDGDISEIGYKYQMTDIAATMGLEGLKTLPQILDYRRELFSVYRNRLRNIPGIRIIGDTPDDRDHAAWLLTVGVPDAADLRRKLEDRGIESSPVHYRNDKYEIFAAFRNDVPEMDRLENGYLALPLHMRLSREDVEYVCDAVGG